VEEGEGVAEEVRLLGLRTDKTNQEVEGEAEVVPRAAVGEEAVGEGMAQTVVVEEWQQTKAKRLR
jgi:pyruvate/2-oxoglutarate dehydrogenase complex dihydrolipoamide acyltransferase (E2) component